jgi:hypothetical protein
MSGDDFLDGLRAARAGLIRLMNRLQNGRLVSCFSPDRGRATLYLAKAVSRNRGVEL